MLRYVLVPVFVAILFAGCSVYGNRQADIAYPRVLELKNTSGDVIYLTAISSSRDAKATFFLEGGPLPPGSIRSWRIRLDAYDDIVSGRFILDGACGDIERWEKQGATLVQDIIEHTDRGTVTVAIPKCGN